MPGELVQAELFVGLIGAFTGLGAELLLRRLLPSEFRFSLRALLIATTLIAAVLGLIVWAVKLRVLGLLQSYEKVLNHGSPGCHG